MKNIKSFPLLMLALVVFVQCAEMPENKQVENSVIANDGLVRSQIEAIDVAQSSIVDFFPTNRLSRSYQVEEIYLYDDVNPVEIADTNSVYVLNFSGGGFAIIPADSRIDGVYGISDEGRFDAPSNESGDPGSFILRQCSNLLAMDRDGLGQIGHPPYERPTVMHDGNLCYVTVTPIEEQESDPLNLVQTQWGQRTPYNYNCPIVEDSTSYTGRGKALVGCVPVAAGQLMAYAQKPTSINGEEVNWELILTSPRYSSIIQTGALATASLLRKIGDAIGVSYGATQTTGYSIAACFYLQNIGFDNASYMMLNGVDIGGNTFTIDDIVDQIDWGMPVIISNASGDVSSNHCWIIDGYRYTMYNKKYIVVATGTVCCSQIIKDNYYMHCNWGWDGQYDGFFREGMYLVGGNLYDGEYRIIYNLY